MDKFEVLGVGDTKKTEHGTLRGNDEGRGSPSLISPHLILRLSKHLQRSTKKYKAGNWAIGQPFSRILDGVYRHLLDYQLGNREEDNLSAAVFGLMCMIHFEETGRESELNDLSELYGLLNENIHVDEMET